MATWKLLMNGKLVTTRGTSNYCATSISCDPLCGAGRFQVKVDTAVQKSSELIITVSARFTKLKEVGDMKLICSCLHKEKEDNIEYEEKLSDDNIWYQIICLSKQYSSGIVFSYDLHLTVEIDLAPVNAVFSEMFHDEDLADFELRGRDGSVSFHKAILAAYSPVLRTMLSGKWKESEEEGADASEMTKQTLEYLKDYMYLQKLPDNKGIKNLLKAASYYMIQDLMTKCVIKILNCLSDDNLIETISFAVEYKVSTLITATILYIQEGSVQLKRPS